MQRPSVYSSIYLWYFMLKSNVVPILVQEASLYDLQGTSLSSVCVLCVFVTEHMCLNWPTLICDLIMSYISRLSVHVQYLAFCMLWHEALLQCSIKISEAAFVTSIQQEWWMVFVKCVWVAHRIIPHIWMIKHPCKKRKPFKYDYQKILSKQVKSILLSAQPLMYGKK